MMNADALAMHDFLAAHHPFDQLPEAALASLPEQLEECKWSSGDVVVTPDAPNSHLYIVRRGAVEVHGPDGKLLARLGEGDCFGQRSLLGNGIPDIQVETIEDTLAYRLRAEVFHKLSRDHPSFQYFFAQSGSARLRGALRSLGRGDTAGLNLTTTAVSQLVARSPVSVSSRTKVDEAARVMSREAISSLMIVDEGRLVGIVTDRDLRGRVIAEGLSYDTPVSGIMTPSPITVDLGQYAFDALLTMARSGLHHLPVMHDERVVGMITDTDLVRRYSTSPLYFVGDIYKRRDLGELVMVSQRLSDMLVVLVDANASAQSIGQVIASIGEAITCRLLVLAEAQLGAPPVPYAWLTGGSLARFEQTAHSDQDNCLLLDDAFQETEHGAYFDALSRFVCDGLNDCGYVYCPGDVMAVNPRWRQPLKAWKRYFDGWIDEPEPKALMHACIFFDLRCLYGDAAMFKELQAYVLERAQRNRLFHAYMASNALHHQPPLGFFRNFVLIKDGEHDHTLDLKHNGVIPITDLARVYALVGGLAAVNTTARLDAAATHGDLSREGGADLKDALEFIGTLRLRHQARQIRTGEAPDNYLSPKDLSQLERKHLKDAFAVVRTIQAAFAQRYQVGRFG